MSKRSAENTIAGYYYQFDKTILEILNKEELTTLVKVEGIEDIDIENLEGETTYIQCKYHSKTRYVPSQIKEPIQLLLREYKKAIDSGKTGLKFVLYAHFKENQEALAEKLEENKLKTTELSFLKTSILSGIKNETEYSVHDELGLNDTDLTNFIQSLEIDINAGDIDEQGKDVINQIKVNFSNCSNREAEYYYNNALKIIFKLSTKDSLEERQITKKDFLREIDNKKFLFNKWYAHLRGKKQYLEYVKWKLKKERALSSNKYKFLFIGKEFLSNEEEVSFEALTQNIIDEYFQVGKSYSTKSKVWTIVLDCDDEEFSKYKSKLYEKGIVPWGKSHSAGFDIKLFNQDPVINTNKNDTISKTSFAVKLITFNDYKTNQKAIKKINSALFFSKLDYKEYFEIDSSEKVSFKLSVIEPDNKLKTLNDISQIFDKVISGNDYLRIVGIQPNSISVEVTKPNTFKEKNENFSLGSFVKITDDNNNAIIGMLQSYKIKDINDSENETIERKEPSFILDIQPMGYLKDNEFKRGGQEITIPPNDVSIADSALLKDIFSRNTDELNESTFSFGTLSYDDEVDIILDGNNFFNKHIALVGSSGSGKSCTVAQILHSGIEQTKKQKEAKQKNNARVIIFDLHGEYKEAFPKCNYLSVDKLKLPYWLLNGEELTDLFIDTAESNSHNQYHQLKNAIVLNKIKHNPNKKIDFDTPAYFSLNEVINYIKNINDLTVYYKDGDTYFAVLPASNPIKYDESKLWERINFENSTGNAKHKDFSEKVSKYGGFNGEFDRFISRLESRKNDNRLDFIIKKGEENKTNELSNIIKQFLGFKEENDISNVTVIDLSGISFDVLSVAVSLISRLMFNFMYYAKKIHPSQDIENPILLVYEEAHNYVPKHNDVKYRAVKESIERIAKEGRKYGVSAMIVSQRPSEISETIFSQCNSFVVMRLTNPTDQNYIKKLMPDSVSSISENLSGLESREALVLGASIPMPTILRVNELADYNKPKSTDVDFMDKWKENWNELETISDIINEMVIPETIAIPEPEVIEEQ
ncbi:ATP-binding protein [Tenacibaculum sp.]|uniref:ATP-binding protein n=1 Tax=Tenacibaculum sp. TaxID=1906242 RepID=UPI003AA93881